MFGFDIFPKVFSCSFFNGTSRNSFAPGFVVSVDFSSKAEIFTFFLFTVFPNFYFSPSTASITFCFKTFIYDSGKKNLLRPSDPLSHSLPFSLTISAALRLLQLGSNRYLDQKRKSSPELKSFFCFK